MSVPSVTIPAEPDELGMHRFHQDAQSVEKVICGTNSAADGTWFPHSSMPSIKHFSYTGCQRFEQGQKIFAAMPNLIGLSYFPVSSSMPQDAEVLQCLDRCGLWEKLDFLYVHQLPVCSPFDQSLPWPALWKGRSLHFVEMNLHFQDSVDARNVFEAKLPRLERLKISVCLGEQVLEWILASQLPMLQYLDLRFNNISSAALTSFATAVTARCPHLTEISIDFYDGEKTEYRDWNGSVVQSLDGPICGEDTTRLYLKGTDLRAVPARTLYF
jgi:hypothetical protein